MKFLCDRCKTRYSIGDDRVRGKILKIRCKNCNNVITVREGMPEPGAVDAATRRNNPTQAVPLQSIEQPMDPQPSGPTSTGALGAAFASAMTKPPPALEEEWYVSIDGEQAGPFSLAQAQRWVASKPFDAELHCWSEGFDDWLPTDKVSHFRGLRKKPAPLPAPAAPPPLPRGATGAHRVVPRPAVEVQEETPKPLFAATMAQLEKSVEPAPAPKLPSLSSLGALANAGLAPHANGSARALHKPSASPTPSGAFDASDAAAGNDVRAATGPAGPNDAFFDELRERKNQLKADAAAARPPQVDPADGDLDGDGDLDIGEVSRVVNLADLARTAPRGTGPQAPIATRQTGPLAPINRTGAVARIGGNTAGVARISAPELGGGLAAPGAFADPNAAVQLAPPPVSHRRGMIALMAGAVLLLGVAGGVVFFVMSNDDGMSGGLGGHVDYDITRPDDPLRRTTGGSAATPPPPQNNPFVPKKNPTVTRPTTPTQPEVPANPGGQALRPDEIEEMAARNSGTTQRCYIRSQRGADAILLGDVRKLGVTLTVDAGGTVTDVKLSDHAQSSLGKCLISSIKGWKFRSSPNGITAKITMVFQSG